MEAREIVDTLLDQLIHQSRVAAEVDRLRAELVNVRKQLRDAGYENGRHERDMESAVAKIAEWSAYACRLHLAIDALDPKKLKRKTKNIALPDWPKPLETEIPF